MQCPNGHPNADGARYCVVCGSQLGLTPPPAPIPPMGQAPAWQSAPPAQPYSPPPAPPASGSRNRLFIIGGVIAIVIIGLIAFMLTRKSSVGPMTASQARQGLIAQSDLQVALETSSGSDSTLKASDTFNPDGDAGCFPLQAASRVGDIPTSLPLGSPVFPDEVKDITVFEGAEFTDTSDEYVSAFDERVMVFPTEDSAKAFMSSLSTSLDQCPTREYYDSEDTVTVQGTYRYVPVTTSSDEVTWNTDSAFSIDSDLDSLDMSFSSTEGTSAVRRGPNVLVASWYRDSDDHVNSESDFNATLAAARSQFLAAPAE